MKNFFNVYVLLLALLFTSTGLEAKDYKSVFGFTADFNNKWLVISRQTLKENKDLFNSPELQGLSPAVIERVIEVVDSGRMELMYRRGDDKQFADNINFMLLTTDKLQLSYPKNSCEAVKKSLKVHYKRETDSTLYSCGYREVGEVGMVMMVFDGAIIGTTNYSYQFHSPEGTVQLTSTCRKGRCDIVANEIDEMFEKIRFH